MEKIILKNKLAVLLFLIALFVAIFFVYDFFRDIQLYRDVESARDVVLEDKDSRGVEEVSISEIANNPDRYFIVDVREKEEFDQGHIIGAKNIRLGDILSRDYPAKYIVGSAAGNKIVFFCHDGERSRAAASRIAEQLGEQVYVIEKGFAQLRENDALAESVWEGVLDRTLPEGFWDDIDDRGFKLDDIGMDIVVDMTSEGRPDAYSKIGVTILHYPVFKMPEEKLKELLGRIGSSEFSAICDSKLSCFYVKFLAYKVESQGGSFAGYYFVRD